MYDFDEDDRSMFADPGNGNSALRAASRRNPRNLPCPTCHEPNMLTRADRALGYQCDSCAMTRMKFPHKCPRCGFISVFTLRVAQWFCAKCRNLTPWRHPA